MTAEPAVRLPRLIHPPDRTGWRLRAACRDSDPELFFPASALNLTQITQAKRICRGCPVIAQCREFAITIPGVSGVWGGLDSEEIHNARRQRLRRERQVTP